MGIFGFIIAIVVAVLYVKSLKEQMSNVAIQSQANVYVVENSFKLDVKKDQFTHSNVVKTPKPQNNGHGGPGGPGGRGGGPGGPRGGMGGGPRGGGGGRR